MSGPATGAEREGDQEAALTWRYDPWREAPRRALASVLVTLAACALITAARPGLLVALGLCVMVAAAFAPAFVPAECRADASGVAVRGPLGWRRRAWSDLRRLEALPSAVLLSPYVTRHVLDAQRAIVLPLPAADRANVLDRLRQALGGSRGT